MKKLYLILSVASLTTYLYAQQDLKRDYNWLFGYESDGHTIDTNYGNSLIDFKTTPTNAKVKNVPMYFNDDIATISDKNGNLLFYTNGIYIADSTHQPMKNGEGLNPGQFADDHKEYGYVCPQGSLIIPKPNNSSLYYLFHTAIILDLNNTPNEYKGEYFYYSLIDISKNNGKGEVIEKNKALSSEFVDIGKITACRHANGEDWWILVADFNNSKINTFLLSQKGIEKKEKQNFSNIHIKGSVGQATFTPDGKKYIRTNVYSFFKYEISIYDFDRCTGKLSNFKFYENTKDTIASIGAAVSPNSRFLYVPTTQKVYQYDLNANDIFGSIDTVAIYDGFKPPEFPVATFFYFAQSAPDGKIYISVAGSAKYLHIIHEPNKKGKACNLEQRGLKLPTFNYKTIPNFPNFRLGAATNNCITSTDETIDENVKIYPNPSQDFFTLDKGNSIANSVAIYDINGRLINTQSIENQTTIINATYLKSGIYYCRLLNDSESISLLKFTIIR